MSAQSSPLKKRVLPEPPIKERLTAKPLRKERVAAGPPRESHPVEHHIIAEPPKPAPDMHPPKITNKVSPERARAEESSRARLILQSIQAAKQALHIATVESRAEDQASTKPGKRTYHLLVSADGTSTDYVRQIRLKSGHSVNARS